MFPLQERQWISLLGGSSPRFTYVYNVVSVALDLVQFTGAAAAAALELDPFFALFFAVLGPPDFIFSFTIDAELWWCPILKAEMTQPLQGRWVRGEKDAERLRMRLSLGSGAQRWWMSRWWLWRFLLRFGSLI